MSGSRWLAACVLVLISCSNDTESDNPLVDFDHSACKRDGSETALVLAPDAGLVEDGFCVNYIVGRESGGARLAISNYPSACGTDFTRATASIEGGTLKLTVHRDACTAARCSGCRYDLIFEVSGPQAASDLDVELHEAGCEGTPLEREPLALTLPVAAQSSGTICEPF